MKNRTKIHIALFALLSIVVLLYTHDAIHASTLTGRSDQLSTSAISTPANHDILFTTQNTIPVSGSIIITPQGSAFTIPSNLDYRSVDLLVNGSNKPLAAVAGSGNNSPAGVSVASGTSGSVTITLNDTNTIASGSLVEIKIGGNASYEAAGLAAITNSSTTGSHIITIETTDALGAVIDSGEIGLSMTRPVGVSADIPSTTVADPTFSPPGGSFANNTSVSINTTTSGASIYYTTDGTTPTASSTPYTGPITITQSTTIKALAVLSGYTDSNVVSASYVITTSSGGGGGGGGGGSFAPPPYIPPPGPVAINGTTGGGASMQCGNGSSILVIVPAGSWDGLANVTLSCLAWSTTTNRQGAPPGDAIADTVFGIYVADNQGLQILIPKKPITAIITYTPGHVAGLTTPFNAIIYNNGTLWSGLESIISSENRQFTLRLNTLEPITVLGQREPLQSCTNIPADLNCDGRVNIVDMSILLYYWEKRGAGIKADINKDGIVNLIDFSIMLYWWTN